MIAEQLKRYSASSCFIFEARVYERLYNHPKRFKYRCIINENDYDYITDRNLRRRLDRAHLALLTPHLPPRLVALFKKNKNLKKL